MAGQSEEIVVTDQDDGERLDQFLVHHFTDVSRARIQTWTRDGLVRVNSIIRKPSFRLTADDRIVVEAETLEPFDLEPIPMDLCILHEDADIIVINKAAGMSVHPGAGTKQPTLVQGVLAHLGKAGLRGGSSTIRPGVVHRLDKDTTGALVFAKTPKAHAHLSQQFHDKTNQRLYIALLNGLMSDAHVDVESYLHRDPGNRTRFTFTEVHAMAGSIPEGHRYAKSHFEAREVFGQRLTLATVRLDTGRTHQIRVHAKQLGVPVWGDRTYGPKPRLNSEFGPELEELLRSQRRQMLHAWKLGFTHPRSGELLGFEADLPDDFRRLISELRHFAKAAEGIN